MKRKAYKVFRPTDDQIANEFWSMTKFDGSSRRRAIATVSRKFGLTPNAVYEAVERVKKLVE